MYINPSFEPNEAHLHHLAFGECERSLGVRAHLVFWEERGSSSKFASLYIPSKFFKWENFSKYENSNFSFTFTLFLNSQHIFSQLQNFSLIKLPWDRLTYFGLHSHIFIQKSWSTYHLRLKHVSSWSYLKISTCRTMFKISVFGRNFTFFTWNWLFIPHDNFVSF